VQDGHDGTQSRALNDVERRILRLLARGLTTQHIAGHIGLPVETVRETLRGVIVKLGARSRLEALLIAIRRGWIDFPLD
jgi:DNA-binding NarL/FixJ family response regulator